MQTMQNVTLEITGMSCGHCVAAVGAALEGVPGVTVRAVTVGSATLAVEPGAAAEAVDRAVRAVEEAGYDAAVADGPRA